MPARPPRAPSVRGRVPPCSGLPLRLPDRGRPVRWAPAHRTVPLAGPGGSRRAGLRKAAPAAAPRPTLHPHTPPRAHSTHPARPQRPRPRQPPAASRSAARARPSALVLGVRRRRRRGHPVDGVARRGARARAEGLRPGPAGPTRAFTGAHGAMGRPRASLARRFARRCAWAWPCVATRSHAPHVPRGPFRPRRLRAPARGACGTRPAPAASRAAAPSPLAALFSRRRPVHP